MDVPARVPQHRRETDGSKAIDAAFLLLPINMMRFHGGGPTYYYYYNYYYYNYNYCNKGNDDDDGTLDAVAPVWIGREGPFLTLYTSPP